MTTNAALVATTVKAVANRVGLVVPMVVEHLSG